MNSNSVKRVKYDIKTYKNENMNNSNMSDLLQVNNMSILNNLNLNNKTHTTATLNATKQDITFLNNNILDDLNDQTFLTSNNKQILDNSLNQNPISTRFISKYVEESLDSSLNSHQLIQSQTINKQNTNMNQILPQIKNSQQQIPVKRVEQQRQFTTQRLFNQPQIENEQKNNEQLFNQNDDPNYLQKKIDDKYQFRDNRQVELGKNSNLSFRNNIKVGQAIKILEQLADKHFNDLQNANNMKRISSGMQINRNARSTSPRLKKILPHQLKELKQIKFLNGLEEKQPSKEFAKKQDEQRSPKYNESLKSPKYIETKNSKDVDEKPTKDAETNSPKNIDSIPSKYIEPNDLKQNENQPQKQIESQQPNQVETISNNEPKSLYQFGFQTLNNIESQFNLQTEEQQKQELEQNNNDEKLLNKQSNSQKNRIIDMNDDSIYYFKRMIINQKNLNISKTDKPQSDRQIQSSPDRFSFKRNPLQVAKQLPPLPVKITFRDRSNDNKANEKQEYKNEFEFVQQEAIKNMVNRPQLHMVNRLKEKKIIEFITSLSNGQKEVDLSDNNLTSICLDLLMNKFNSMQISLETLRLQNTGITDDSISILQNAFSVNLSKNSIANNGCLEIRYIIQSNPSLKEFYLSWNKFNSEGGSMILDSIQNDTYIKVLDLSNNSLGHGQLVNKSKQIEKHYQYNKEICLSKKLFFNEFIFCFKIYQYLIKPFKFQFLSLNYIKYTLKIEKLLTSFDKIMRLEQQDGLIHLDLRMNSFSREDLIEMNKSISINKSIPCIHLSHGHQCYMDSCNNLRLFNLEQQVLVPQQADFFPIHTINHKRTFRKKKNDDFENLEMIGGDNCWICEGWIEHEFQFFLSSNQLNFWESEENVYLHLEIDNYLPTKMIKSLIRMIPPQTSIKFFFSYDGRIKIFLSQDVEIIQGIFQQVRKLPQEDNNHQTKKNNDTQNQKDIFKVDNNILYINAFNIIRSPSPQCLYNENYALNIQSLPRQDIFLQNQDQLMNEEIEKQNDKKPRIRFQNKAPKNI